MEPFQFVTVKANTPGLRGMQYGEQAKAKIRAGIESYREYFEKTGDRNWAQIKEHAMAYIPLIEEAMPEILEEAKGIAKGAGIEFSELMVLNCRYEITKFPKTKECTTAAILPEAAGDKTYLVKNWDYRKAIQGNIVIVHIEQEDGTRIMGLAEAGQMLREGFNSHGVGLCNNMIQSVHDTRGVGIPVTFLRRRVLASKSFEEAKTLLATSKRSVSNNMMLVSGNGRAIDLEAYPGGVDFIEPKGGIVTHANHFVVHPELDALPSPKNRDTRLSYLLRRQLGSIDVEFIKECLKDHEYYPLSICAHNVDDAKAGLREIMTVASIIIDFQAGIAHICAGPPCRGEYIAYPL